jgi:hypothetical protein
VECDEGKSEVIHRPENALCAQMELRTKEAQADCLGLFNCGGLQPSEFVSPAVQLRTDSARGVSRRPPGINQILWVAPTTSVSVSLE